MVLEADLSDVYGGLQTFQKRQVERCCRPQRGCETTTTTTLNVVSHLLWGVRRPGKA